VISEVNNFDVNQRIAQILCLCMGRQQCTLPYARSTEVLFINNRRVRAVMSNTVVEHYTIHMCFRLQRPEIRWEGPGNPLQRPYGIGTGFVWTVLPRRLQLNQTSVLYTSCNGRSNRTNCRKARRLQFFSSSRHLHLDLHRRAIDQCATFLL